MYSTSSAPTSNAVHRYLVPPVDRRVGLGDDEVLAVHGRKVLDNVGHLGGLDLPVGRLDEPVVVDTRIGSERDDEADVRTFRRFDRADPTVVGRVHIAHFEARPFAGEPAGTQGRQPALVRDLGEGVRLVHELRELAGTEKFLDGRDHGLGVDDVMGHERVNVLEAHALLDGALHAREADPDLVLEQLTHGTHPAVPEMVDVVHFTPAGPEIHQVPDDLDHILGRQRRLFDGDVELQLLVQLEPAHGRQVVPLGIEEHAREQVPRHLDRRRFAGAHLPVDLEQRLVGGRNLVGQQRIADRGNDMDPVHVNNFHLLYLRRRDLGQERVGDLLVRGEEHFAGLGVDDIAEHDAVDQLLAGYGYLRNARRLHPLDRGARDLGSLLHDHFAGRLVGDRIRRLEPGQHVSMDASRESLLLDPDVFNGVVHPEKILVRIAERLEKDRRRDLPASVDPHVDDVLYVEFEIQPRTAVRDDPGGVQDLAARMRPSLVVREERAGRPVQLAHHDALRSVDDKGPGLGHERKVADIDLLLLDILDPFRGGLLILFEKHEARLDLERRGVGGSPLQAFPESVLRVTERVPEVVDHCGLVEVVNGIHALECRLQPDVLALVRRELPLEKQIVGPLLDLDQVGNLEDGGNP